LLFTLTKNGRVEPVNYRTTKIPTGDDIPLFVKEEFGEFYKAMFDQQVQKENMRTVFLEYAWDMGWCDPCAADPVPNEDLKSMGAWWIDAPDIKPMNSSRPMPRRIIPPQGAEVFITRLHVRYDAKTFPEDLILQVTDDKKNFQGRYVMRHPWAGETQCEMANTYRAGLKKRFDKEAQNLANLTGWNIDDIRKKMEQNGQSVDLSAAVTDNRPWWEIMWGKH